MTEKIINGYTIRLEQEADYKEVEDLTREAFWDVYRPGCSEHLVLHQLRNDKDFIRELDWVVLDGSKIIANIVYSKSYVLGESGQKQEVITFGPVSVHPDYQKQGIGKALINFTLKKAEELGYKAVVITGSNQYYSQFGFESASRYGIYLEGMPKEEEAPFFMVLALQKGFLENCQGICSFSPAFETSEEELEAFEKYFPEKKKREPLPTDL